jgi:CRISPR-associated endonuclease/helicase Cas3
VGTVDMIGSRLLFSGYGNGPNRAAQHAALLGHGVLVVNDEAHLTPSLAGLLRKLENLQTERLKPSVTIRLSATHPSSGCGPESLEEDGEEPLFQRSFEAANGLDIQPVSTARLPVCRWSNRR